VALIRKNLQTLDVQSGATILALDVLRALQKIAANSSAPSSVLDIVFLDPPYAAAQDYHRVLAFLGTAPFLKEGSLVVAEHRSSLPLPASFGNLSRVRVLRQGDATLSFYRFNSNNLQPTTAS
jgi:16S rRNA (guanine966-N2)-methyltransferase